MLFKQKNRREISKCDFVSSSEEKESQNQVRATEGIRHHSRKGVILLLLLLLLLVFLLLLQQPFHCVILPLPVVLIHHDFPFYFQPDHLKGAHGYTPPKGCKVQPNVLHCCSVNQALCASGMNI